MVVKMGQMVFIFCYNLLNNLIIYKYILYICNSITKGTLGKKGLTIPKQLKLENNLL